MRHKFWPALSVLLALACVFLWQRGKTPYQVDDLRLQGMLQARARFLDYLNYGDEGDYWYGAAEFQTMVNAAKLENLNGQIDANAVMGVWSMNRSRRSLIWTNCAAPWRRVSLIRTILHSGRFL